METKTQKTCQNFESVGQSVSLVYGTNIYSRNCTHILDGKSSNKKEPLKDEDELWSFGQVKTNEIDSLPKIKKLKSSTKQTYWLSSSKSWPSVSLNVLFLADRQIE